MHAPRDETVGIENATEIFLAAKHPKSFISLDAADHMLSDPADAAFAAQAMAGWLSRYVPADTPQEDDVRGNVRVKETGEGRFQNMVRAGRHRLFADEPMKMGGPDSGPTPYDFLSIALGACTSMTLRLYADRKNFPWDASASTSHTTRSMPPTAPSARRTRRQMRRSTASRAPSPWTLR